MTTKMISFEGLFLVLLCIIEATQSVKAACGKWDNNKNIPWAIGIYSSKAPNKLELICQGTLLMENVVVTSSRCVCGSIDNKIREDISVSTIVADRVAADSDLIKIDPKEINCHEDYKGFFIQPSADIAVIKTTKNIAHGSTAHPVCIDWTDLQIPSIEKLKSGLLVNWDGDLKYSKASFLNFDSCNMYTSENFIYNLDSDKICLKTESIQKDVKNIGSGVIIKNPNDGLYYLEGVVSYVDPDTNKKDENTFVAATSVRQYISWIAQKCATR